MGGESKIKTDIRDKLCNGPIRLWNNPVGVGVVIGHKHSFTRQAIITKVLDLVRSLGGFANRQKFGLAVGSGDLIGYRRVTITPEMVGRDVAVFLSCEVKTEKGAIREEQFRWAAHINSVGGIAVIARSLDAARAELDKPFIGVDAKGSDASATGEHYE